MKTRLKQIATVFLAACVLFSGLPFMAGDIDAHAMAKKRVAKNVTLRASANGQNRANLSWNKIKKPQKGYAVFRDGRVIAHCGKRLSFSDSGLKAGTTYRYQIKIYKTKKTKQWYNKKTGQWQKKKPKKKYRGKKRNIVTYSYQKPSNNVYVKTAAAPKPAPKPAPQPTIIPEQHTSSEPKNGPVSYTVTWKNYDKSVLSTETAFEGTVPSYNGPAPTRPSTDEYDYVFYKWSPTPTAITADTTYIAMFRANRKPGTEVPTVKKYNITWKNWDGSVLKTDSVYEGKTPSYTEATPTRPSDDKYDYTFDKWSPDIASATSDAVYIATYTAKEKVVTPITNKEFTEYPSTYIDTFAGVRMHLGQSFSEVSSALSSKANGYDKIVRTRRLSTSKGNVDEVIHFYNTNSYQNFLAVYVADGQIVQWTSNSEVFGIENNTTAARGQLLNNGETEHLTQVCPLPSGSSSGALIASFSLPREGGENNINAMNEKKLGFHLLNAMRVAKGRNPVVRDKYLEGADLTTGEPLTYTGTIKGIDYTNQRYGAQGWAETMYNNKKCTHSGTEMTAGPCADAMIEDILFVVSRDGTGKGYHMAGETVGGGSTGEYIVLVYATSSAHLGTMLAESVTKAGFGLQGNYHCEQFTTVE